MLVSHELPLLPIETHPLQPFLPDQTQVLLLGSFPPPRTRWRMEFYYPNFQNDMWRVMGLVFFKERDYFIDVASKSFHLVRIKQFLNDQGIAIFDTAYRVQRQQGDAADQHLHIVEATDVVALCHQLPQCGHIVTTGDKATDTLMSVLPPDSTRPTLQQTGECHLGDRSIQLHRMPSTSRAYPLALEKKAERYQQLFNDIGLLH